MMNMDWKQSLDRYLTTPPDDGFDGWCEQVIDAVSAECYEQHEAFFDETGGLLDTWLNKLFRDDVSIEYVATAIERAIRLYRINKSPIFL